MSRHINWSKNSIILGQCSIAMLMLSTIVVPHGPLIYYSIGLMTASYLVDISLEPPQPQPQPPAQPQPTPPSPLAEDLIDYH